MIAPASVIVHNEIKRDGLSPVFGFCTAVVESVSVVEETAVNVVCAAVVAAVVAVVV